MIMQMLRDARKNKLIFTQNTFFKTAKYTLLFKKCYYYYYYHGTVITSQPKNIDILLVITTACN